MTDPKNPTPERTAEDAYVRAHGQATELVDAIYGPAVGSAHPVLRACDSLGTRWRASVPSGVRHRWTGGDPGRGDRLPEYLAGDRGVGEGGTQTDPLGRRDAAHRQRRPLASELPRPAGDQGGRPEEARLHRQLGGV
ncbi:MAG: hypothetical protein SNJ49_08675 [Chloracidobacterium sp.]